MKTNVIKVAIRKNAIVIQKDWITGDIETQINETTSEFLANCAKLGYTFSEELLYEVNRISPLRKLEIFNILKEVSGVNKNWTPLVKQWDISTNETIIDHIITWFSNVFHLNNGTKLPCGHLIPENTFPIEHYNGCPFCGTPFQFDELNYTTSENKLKILELWTENDLKNELKSLLESPVVLDATQVDGLNILIHHFGVSNESKVKIKETLMIVIDALVESNQLELAGQFFKTPTDILRYLWFKHTGLLQIIEPKTIVNRMKRNASNLYCQLDKSSEVKIKALSDLKLKFNRSECRMYANWLNNLSLDIPEQCENMHSKRGIWVRVIRALRLTEFSKKKGFENLAELLDLFYTGQYEVWQGKVNHFKLKTDAAQTFALLKQRPGLFARSLFSTMLWFGPDVTIQHFKEILNQVPSRLIFTLNMYADLYFDKNASRMVKPLGGISKRIEVNKLLCLYSDDELKRMQSLIQDLSFAAIKSKLQNAKTTCKTMYIDNELFNIPFAIGDRTDHIQDLQGALMGTKFKVAGENVRLFLQWGEGLPAQHLDMDLSCNVAYENESDFCSYSRLTIPGCQHSGDIQNIPNKVGTAEYIDVNLNKLTNLGAKYVSFTCNSYTNGSLTPNLTVGWMNSEFPMKISPSGVAYNPSSLQHQVRIKQSLTKGMVFGVLDVVSREIIWLEMPFDGQIVQNLDVSGVETLTKKLDAKLKIGNLLKLKSEVQNLTIVQTPEEANEIYDMQWAMNTSEVSKMFLDKK
ncbi:hypothetical protein [Brumimicrobium mesophilum]|uniref:hypothetical protein n=1 Tax=Brumimicrobium mesophilum TaxID=392717 RepID=UPI000D141C59|nr:hypothetical protein [Brumimicrobium mesophilum]